MELPLAPVERIIRNAGAKRVSADATKQLAKYLEEEATKIAEKAIKLCKNSKRKTVNAGDIKISA